MTIIETKPADPQPRTLIPALCRQLGHGCRNQTWGFEVTARGRPFSVEWGYARDALHAVVALPILSGYHPRGPDSDVQAAVLRRNARLSAMRWCLTRHGHLAVSFAFPLAGLTAESLGAAFDALIEESNAVFVRAEEGWVIPFNTEGVPA